MCDGAVLSDGWQGWLELPAARALQARGPWVDLSHPLGPDMPRQPFFPVPEFGHFRQRPGFPLNITRMDMVVHLGTHVDSPRHRFNDGPAFEDVPLERLWGPGLICRIDAGGAHEIGPAQLEAACAGLEPGDILILNTGMHHLAGSAAYQDHPWLSVAAAQWLVDHQVKMLAIDTPTPEMPHAQRGPGFDFPVHERLLGHGVLVAEHLTNLDGLTGQRIEVLCNALNIHGGDGAPTRILARRVAA
ncbi:cyclase family protein [Castellaniella sp.]|uniref:cyclase family protein n=1 Tax=Castellaniella sp. TaxID=1955812 RepID=UPI00355DE818